MGLLIKGTDTHRQKWSKHRRIGTARNHEVLPGRHYALVDKRAGQGSRIRERVIDGETVRMEDGLGYTQDREVAAAAAAHDFFVVEREQPIASGKLFFAMSSLGDKWDKIDWHHKNEQEDVDGSRPDAADSIPGASTPPAGSGRDAARPTATQG